MSHFRSSFIWRWILAQTQEGQLNGAEHATCQSEARVGEETGGWALWETIGVQQFVSAVAHSELTLKNVVRSFNWGKRSGALVSQGSIIHLEARMILWWWSIITHDDKVLYMWTDCMEATKGKDEDKHYQLLIVFTLVLPHCAMAARTILASSGAHNKKSGAVSHIGSLNNIFCLISHTSWCWRGCEWCEWFVQSPSPTVKGSWSRKKKRFPDNRWLTLPVSEGNYGSSHERVMARARIGRGGNRMCRAATSR